METLKLEHLAGYLPYDLQAICTRTKEVRAVTLNHFTYDLKTVGLNHLLIKGLIIEEHKPLLYPLSCLTEYNEELCFIPLIELAKIAYPKNRPFSDFFIKGNYVKLDNWNIGGYSLHFDIKEISFDCRAGFDGSKWRNNCYVPNQFKLIQKLYEWHFAIDIPEHLYLDKRTVIKK